MTGKILIRGKPVPEGLRLEEAHVALGYQITTEAVFGSRLEMVDLVYALGKILEFEEADWDVLRMIIENREGIAEYSIQSGGVTFIDDEEDGT